MLQQLPELLLDLICDHLSYEDVLALQLLQSTCKGLKAFVDAKEFTTLNLFVRKFPFYRRLFYTGDPIGYPRSYHSDDLSILTSNRLREQFINVQKMAIFGGRCFTDSRICSRGSSAEFDLKLLPCFLCLRHLEIDKFPCIKGNLHLQNLRIAAFRILCEFRKPDLTFELDCQRLKALSTNYCRAVLTSTTDQLDCMCYDDFEDRNDYLRNISPNLQKLTTIGFERIALLLQFLSDLKTCSLNVLSLSEIRFEPPLFSLIGLDELARSLEDLKRDPRTKCIKFTWTGRPIHSADEFRCIVGLIRAHEAETYEATRLYCLDAFNELHGNDMLGAQEFNRQFKRFLEMMSEHLNLESLQIIGCKYESLKPLAKFRNLELVSLDYDPQREELTHIYTNSRTLEIVNILCHTEKWGGRKLIKPMKMKTHEIEKTMKIV